MHNQHIHAILQVKATFVNTRHTWAAVALAAHELYDHASGDNKATYIYR